MKRLTLAILLSALTIPATATAQEPPVQPLPDDPYSGGVHEGTKQVWMCLPNLQGNGQICSWVWDTGPGHSHGEEPAHDHDDDDHKPDPLATVSASSQAQGVTVNLTPSQWSERPTHYRVLVIDTTTKNKKKKRLHVEHVSPDNLTSTIEYTAPPGATVQIKVQAVGECKRKKKRDANAKKCSRRKSKMVTTVPTN